MLDPSKMPSSFLMKNNLSLARGLVKMSSSWCSLSINSMQQSPFDIWSLRKWYIISICLALEFMIGFLDRLIALVLSHFKEMWLRITPKSLSCYFIQRLWSQQLPAAIYSAYVVDNATQACFL